MTREPAAPDPAAAPVPDLRAVPWRAFLGYFLGLGTWGFGGPIATVGYMQRDLVERPQPTAPAGRRRYRR